MNVRLGKWEKNGIRRIYFNSELLGECKAFAFAKPDGTFDVGSRFPEGCYSPQNSAFVNEAHKTGVAALEAALGRAIDYKTLFADVWAAVK